MAGAFLMSGIGSSPCLGLVLKSLQQPWKKHRHGPPCRRAGATPKTFWAAGSPKSGVAPARFSVFSTAALVFCCWSLAFTTRKITTPHGEGTREGGNAGDGWRVL